MGRARSMPCDISNYSNVSSDLGSWYLDVLLFFGFSRSNISLHARRARTSFVFGLTHRVRSGSRDDCACMAPGCRLSRLLPAMRCVAGRRILKLIKRLTRLRRPGEWGPRTGYPELTPIRCPDPGRPRSGLVPGLAEVWSTCPATRSARPEPVRVPRAYPDSRLNSRKIPASGCSAIHGVRLVALMMFVMVQRQGRSHAEEAVFNLPRERACDRPRPARLAGYERGLGAYVQVVTDLPVDLAHLARGVEKPLQHVLPHARLPEAAAHALDRFHDRIDHVGG